MSVPDTDGLIYDWNEKDRRGPIFRKKPRFVDETIRDGLQSPSVRDPTIEQKMELIRLMERMGIHVVNLSDPTDPRMLGTLSTPDQAEGVLVWDGLMMAVDRSGTVSIADAQCK